MLLSAKTHTHTQAGQARILRKRATREKCRHVNMLNQSFRQSAIYHGSAGSTLVNCSTMWFLSGGLDKFRGPRLPNSLDGTHKTTTATQRVSFHICPTVVVSLDWLVRAFVRSAHSCGYGDIPLYTVYIRTTVAVKMASSQISKPG